jgi:putative SOS response-associated peptidase YedK
MCGRFTLKVTHRPELLVLGLGLADRFNIAPHSSVLIFDQDLQARLVPWCYDPGWQGKPLQIINARSETLREKPAFRDAKRCVFVADGWYEWRRTRGGKVAYYCHHHDGLLYFAGIYKENSGAAIVTRAAVEELFFIHPRQPVVLEPRAVVPWLQGNDLFGSGISHHIAYHPVSDVVNQPTHDGPELIKPIPRDMYRNEPRLV